MIGKILLGGAALLAGSFGLRAESVVRLSLTDGREISFAFSAKPEATFAANELTLTAVGVEPLTVSVEDVVGFDFPDMSRINETARESLVCRLTTDNVVIEGVTPGTEISLYLYDGTVAIHYSADSSGVSVIPRSDLPQGVSIVRVGNRSFKLML